MGTLDGGHAFVTGGGSGIGLGAARTFIADGARVTICGRTVDRLEAAVAELGEMARFAVVDVGDEASLSTALDQANEVEPLSIAVVNAGMGAASPFLASELTDWENVMRTNVTGAFLTMKLAGAHLEANGGGSMCAVSSIAGSRTHRFMTAYTTSKAALEMLVRNAADELGSLGIRVNAVAPGLVETDISSSLRNDDAVALDYHLNTPLGRQGTTDDTAAAIRFLCGPESSWITGVVMPVDGGQHLRRGPNLDPLLAPFVPNLPPLSADS